MDSLDTAKCDVCVQQRMREMRTSNDSSSKRALNSHWTRSDKRPLTTDTRHPCYQTTSISKIQEIMIKQKDLSSEDMELERSMHRSLIHELSLLTSSLKFETENISQAVAVQNIKLESVRVHTSENSIEIDKQRKSVGERGKWVYSVVFTNIVMILYIVSIFSLTCMIVRMIPDVKTM